MINRKCLVLICIFLLAIFTVLLYKYPHQIPDKTQNYRVRWTKVRKTRAPPQKTFLKLSLNSSNTFLSFRKGECWSRRNCITDSDYKDYSYYTNTTLETPAGDTKIYIYKPRKDRFISRIILKRGIWEGDLVRLLVRLMRQDKELVFLDIGANVGTYALSMAKLGRKVVAIEPFPPTHYLLCKSIQYFSSQSHGRVTKFHNFKNNIYLVNNVLSNIRHNMTFDDSQFTQNRNIGGIKVKNATSSDTKLVESILLDDLLHVFSFDKVMIKMDIENHEQKVLEGAGRFFSAVDVKVVLMEWMGKTRKQAVDVHQIMKGYHMEPYSPKTKLPIPEDQVSGSWFAKYGNILWIKQNYSLHHP